MHKENRKSWKRSIHNDVRNSKVDIKCKIKIKRKKNV